MAPKDISPTPLDVLHAWTWDDFPDAVFVEDAALCIASHAVVLRPGAPSRAGEADAIVADLDARFSTVARVERPRPT